MKTNLRVGNYFVYTSFFATNNNIYPNYTPSRLKPGGQGLKRYMLQAQEIDHKLTDRSDIFFKEIRYHLFNDNYLIIIRVSIIVVEEFV
ncbi:MAG: hypothetical protein ABI653_06345 [Bacteroidota bacterium]